MDAWNPDQLRRMQLGGNEKLNKFLQQYGVPKATEIREKYNCKAAGAGLAGLVWLVGLAGGERSGWALSGQGSTRQRQAAGAAAAAALAMQPMSEFWGAFPSLPPGAPLLLPQSTSVRSCGLMWMGAPSACPPPRLTTR